MRCEFGTNAEWMICNRFKLRSAQSHYVMLLCYYNLIWLLHCNAMNFDSFSLGTRHLFQNVVLLSYIAVFRIKISIRITY
jgi:hypothetical protein